LAAKSVDNLQIKLTTPCDVHKAQKNQRKKQFTLCAFERSGNGKKKSNGRKT